jgi:hypothetical protein
MYLNSGFKSCITVSSHSLILLGKKLTPRSIFSLSVRFRLCTCLLRFLFSHVMATAYAMQARMLRQMNETQMA